MRAAIPTHGPRAWTSAEGDDAFISKSGMPSLSSVLVIKLSSLGDVVFCLHAVRQLKELTGARIAWVVDCGIAPVLEGHPAVDEIIHFPREPYLRGWSPIRGLLPGLVTLARRVRSEEFDLAVDFQGRARSYALLQVCRARRKIGRGRFPFLMESIHPLYRHPRHAVESYLEVLDCIGIGPVDAHECAYPIAADSSVRIGQLLETHKVHRPYAALIPGTSWPSKCWPPEHWREIADWLEKRGYHILLIGTGRERTVVGKILQGFDRTRRISSVAGWVDLRDLGALLAGSAITIGGDTGPIHLATAAGAKVLALYGPTDPHITGPWPPSSAPVLQAPECTLCRKPHCRRRCMRHLDVSRVIQALSELVEEPVAEFAPDSPGCGSASKGRIV